jgi:hypothetical protein
MNNNKVVVVDLLGSLFEYKQEFFKRLSLEIYNRYNKRICNKTIEKWINNSHCLEGLENLSASIGENITLKDFEKMFMSVIFKDRYSIGKYITKRRYVKSMLDKIQEKNISIVVYSFLDDDTIKYILSHFKLHSRVDIYLSLNNNEDCITKEIVKWYPNKGDITLISSSSQLDKYYKESNFNSYLLNIKEIQESALYIYSAVMFNNLRFDKCA